MRKVVKKKTTRATRRKPRRVKEKFLPAVRAFFKRWGATPIESGRASLLYYQLNLAGQNRRIAIDTANPDYPDGYLVTVVVREDSTAHGRNNMRTSAAVHKLVQGTLSTFKIERDGADPVMLIELEYAGELPLPIPVDTLFSGFMKDGVTADLMVVERALDFGDKKDAPALWVFH